MFIFFVYKSSIFFSQLSENLSLIGSKKFGSFQHPHLQEISWFLSIKRVPRRNNLGRINSHFLLIKSIIVSSAFSTKTIIYIYVNCGHTSHGALFIIENRAGSLTVPTRPRLCTITIMLYKIGLTWISTKLLTTFMKIEVAEQQQRWKVCKVIEDEFAWWSDMKLKVHFVVPPLTWCI